MALCKRVTGAGDILSELYADTASGVYHDECEMDTSDSKAGTSSVSKQLQPHP
jgi:hypothetical protein